MQAKLKEEAIEKKAAAKAAREAKKLLPQKKRGVASGAATDGKIDYKTWEIREHSKAYVIAKKACVAEGIKDKNEIKKRVSAAGCKKTAECRKLREDGMLPNNVEK